MEYLITKIKLFLILHKRKIDVLIFIFFYLLFLEPNLLDTLTSCPPTPVDPGLPACLDAQRLAIEDLQKNGASKSWLTEKAQTIGANGMQGEKGIGTVLKGWPSIHGSSYARQRREGNFSTYKRLYAWWFY
jgi:hypothetical protein